MAGMWKPGEPPPPDAMVATAGDATREDNPVASPSKKLSGAVLNMKFMKRSQNPSSSMSPSQQSMQGMSTPASRNSIMSPEAVASPSFASADPQQQQEETMILAGATPVEMYGPERSVVLGRRSFGGFRPSVQAAYRNSCRRPSPGTTDEELLERYRKFATGDDKRRHSVDGIPQEQGRSSRGRRNSQGLSRKRRRKDRLSG